MDKIRVCIVSPLFHPDLGGVGRQAVLLTSKLRESGLEPLVFTRKMKNTPEFIMPYDIPLVYIPAFRPGVHNLEEKSFLNFLTSLSFSIILAFKLFSMRKKYEIVHFHGASLPLIVCLPLLKLLRKKIIAKVLASRIGTEAGSLKGRYFFLGNLFAHMLKRTDAYIAISKEIVDSLRREGINPKNIFHISNFVDTEIFKPADDKARLLIKHSLSVDKKLVINFTGRIVKRKGIDVLINTMEKNKEILTKAILIIIGTGPEEDRIKNLVSRLGITENVKFIGHSSEVFKLYQASDIFVLPSYAEGMPNSLLEAMACSVSVVASRIGGVVDVVEDGKSGMLFNPGDPISLSSSMLRLIEDSELRRRLGEEARKVIMKDFSIESITANYMDVYREVLAR